MVPLNAHLLANTTTPKLLAFINAKFAAVSSFEVSQNFIQDAGGQVFISQVPQMLWCSSKIDLSPQEYVQRFDAQSAILT